jgi:FKBP-type peptidyl-prolyl cis-trans isomerase SlyD
MIVSKDKVVSLTYELRLGSVEGEIVESLTKEDPLSFLFGSGGLLPKFEENINGLQVGDSFKFGLQSTEAYGDINNEAIVDVPIHAFEIDGKLEEKLLRIGNKIPMQDTSGNKLVGIVKEINTDLVRMDFNHPLAGSNLFFNGEITEIREATDEELKHGHIHSSCDCGGSCSDSGCGDGSCNDSGCGDGSCNDSGCGDGCC